MPQSAPPSPSSVTPGSPLSATAPPDAAAPGPATEPSSASPTVELRLQTLLNQNSVPMLDELVQLLARELAEALRVAFGALVPPMSDSGQRSLSSSGPKEAASTKVPSSGTPSFVNASTMRSTPAEGMPALGATGSAVVDARA